MEKERFRVFPDRQDDLTAVAKAWNARIPRKRVIVLKVFGWEGRWTVPGEEMDLPVCDAKDVIFRGKARLA